VKRALLACLFLGTLALVAVAGLTTMAPQGLQADSSAAATKAGKALRDKLDQAPAPLRAGAAAVEITVPAEAPLGGYFQLQARRAASEGLATVSALALAAGEMRIVLTSLDAVTITPALHDAVRRRLEPPIALVNTATHTHSGPGGLGRTTLEALFLGSHDRALFNTVVQAHADAASEALQHLRPVRLHHGAAPAHDLIFNRTERAALIDPSVDIVELTGGGGRVARLVSFGAHPTLVRVRDRVDGDYPAAMRAALAERGERFPTLFTAGATGSAGAQRPKSGYAPGHLGRGLAKVVRGIGLRASGTRLALAHARAELPMPAPRIPLSYGRVLRPWLSGGFLPSALPVDLVRIGPVLVAVLPGELSGELTAPLRRRFRDAGLQLVLASHNGVYAGYFMPAARYGHPGPEQALELYGPGAGEVVVAFLDGVREALAQAEADQGIPHKAPQPIPGG